MRRIVFRGVVQGVGFRPTVYRIATSLGRKGSVRNAGSSVIVEIDEDEVFLKELIKNLPPLAEIESIEKEDISNYDCSEFKIIESSIGNGIGIPADTCICDKCLEDMRNGRRKGYPFTTCTECGARFTLMESAPYDRKNTSMESFPLCNCCSNEYSNSIDRRFHHQTICCNDCGPAYRFIDCNAIEYKDPIKKFAEAMDNGCIGICKGWGGMHICCSLDNVNKLREWYGRKYKPFAVMMKDIETIKKYCSPTSYELDTITSPQRPIVLVKKNGIDDAVSPGLDTVGVFLPYTGMHHILFDNMKCDSLIMTSANIPGNPMALDDNDAISLNADVYLLHNQPIINRADDSVVKFYQDRKQFIRKSRGYVPSYIPIKFNGSSVGIGAQENLTSSVSIDGRIYSSQHIGDAESFGVLDFLQSATDSLISMTGCVPSAIVADMHPGYANKKFGKSLSEKYNCNMIEAQHHWAHCASLMVDSGLDEIVALAVDGTGYGADGEAWGGEVISCDFSTYERIAHLQYLPLIGNDKPLYDIRRLCFAIDSINKEYADYVSEPEKQVFSKLMINSPRTSSLGRILDAISYKLGVCNYRTYDGEPAMRLEPLLSRGFRLEGFDAEVENNVIKTVPLFQDLPKAMKEDIAFSIVDTIIEKMVEAACDAASKKGIRNIGITGGVSYSKPITNMFVKHVEHLGYVPILHNHVPNGDGGVSVGQAAIGSRMIE